MKRLIFTVLVALAACASLPAQQASLFSSETAGQPLLFAAAPTADFSTPAPIPSAALPEAPRTPQPRRDGDFGNRWTLASGYEYVHFKSAPFSANMSGIHTVIGYSLTEWFALEGSVVAAFGGDVFQKGEMAKYALLTGGGRIFWTRDPRKWSPWARVLVGDLHMNPQTAFSSRNGFAVQAGGGVDYFINPRLSMRGEGEYVRSQLYKSSQNNFQAGISFVLHF
jgi:hypothetical protein